MANKPPPESTAPPATAADAAAAADADAPPSPLPTRIEPVPGPDGQPLDLGPPCGGRWLRHADGGLAPADAGTAQDAGLAWPG